MRKKTKKSFDSKCETESKLTRDKDDVFFERPVNVSPRNESIKTIKISKTT